MLVLASASKARRKLLDQIALKYKVIVSNFDESSCQEFDPTLKAKFLAEEKAQNVLEKLKNDKEYKCLNFQGLLACDSLFEFEGEIFGKPMNKDQLISRWQRMKGKSGFLHTGHYLTSIKNSKNDLEGISIERSIVDVVSTKIEFINLSNNEIIKYASKDEPYKCAGGFAIEGYGGLFIENIYGCFSNVIGLSLPWLKTNLEKIGLFELMINS
tara:strand:+ start:63 stop:701 length:639 start_codon:yes stop_codon:yes gene_type:complete